MVDGRKNNGGPRPGSGRKSKAEELGLVELLNEAVPMAKQKTILRKLATDALSTTAAVRHPARVLLLSYLYGKPKERHEVEHSGSMEHNVFGEVALKIDKIYGRKDGD